MKALLIGIDGGDKRILDFFDKPYYRELKQRTHSRAAEEDLVGRGWAKIMTGLGQEATGAFYMAPKLDGTCQFSPGFRMKDCIEVHGIKPIWDLMGRRGCKVGIMNVPTTTPVFKVNGFLIGSAGAGLYEIEGIPASIIPGLKQNGYVMDIRLKPSGIRRLEDLFDRLKAMESIRAKTFVQLCKEQGTEFGFVVDRGTTVIQYLAMGEIEQLMAEKRGDRRAWRVSERLRDLLHDYYSQLDNNIRFVVEALMPEHLIITADHGHAPYTHRGNMDAFLRRHGWLTKGSVPVRALRKARARGAHYLPDGTLKDALSWLFKEPESWFVRDKTKAFGTYHCSGVYINDSRRFGGPVPEGQEMRALVREICGTFNASSEAGLYGMQARPYRERHMSARFADQLPDIIIEHPDSIFFDGRTTQLIRPNPNYGPLPPLEDVDEDMFTGQKGRHPVLLMDFGTQALVRQDDPRDLTIVYHLIDRIFR